MYNHLGGENKGEEWLTWGQRLGGRLKQEFMQSADSPCAFPCTWKSNPASFVQELWNWWERLISLVRKLEESIRVRQQKDNSKSYSQMKNRQHSVPVELQHCYNLLQFSGPRRRPLWNQHKYHMPRCSEMVSQSMNIYILCGFRA